MSDDAARRRRHAQQALEAAFVALETALALGRDAVEASSLVDKAVARDALDPGDRAKAATRRLQLSAIVNEQRSGGVEAYAREHGLGGTRAWTSSGGAKFFRIVTESFPRHVNYVYVIEIDDEIVLWDCASGLFSSRQMILDGMKLLERAYGFVVEPKDIDVILVSHGHYDHFGDAKWWKEAAQAPLWIHELDARVVESFEERTVMTGRDMAVWLAAAGCTDDDVAKLVSMYLASKEMYSSVAVDRRLRHGQKLFHDRARLIHTPGHCPGHLCMRVDDVILVADQVLSPITPHLSPQALHPQNGLDRYLAGLARLMREADAKIILPAHYDDIPDLAARIREIAEDHVAKLDHTRAICVEGATIVDVAKELFGHQEGYSVLLAILEAGTHVEYLHQLGALTVANLDDVTRNPREPCRYRARAVDAAGAVDVREGFDFADRH
jgi:glyoxylase-like metal-dependent hydrolase (beta-lactamase superfamily II)